MVAVTHAFWHILATRVAVYSVSNAYAKLREQMFPAMVGDTRNPSNSSGEIERREAKKSQN